MHLKYLSGPESYREFRETGPLVIKLDRNIPGKDEDEIMNI